MFFTISIYLPLNWFNSEAGVKFQIIYPQDHSTLLILLLHCWLLWLPYLQNYRGCSLIRRTKSSITTQQEETGEGRLWRPLDMQRWRRIDFEEGDESWWSWSGSVGRIDQDNSRNHLNNLHHSQNSLTILQYILTCPSLHQIWEQGRDDVALGSRLIKTNQLRLNRTMQESIYLPSKE